MLRNAWARWVRLVAHLWSVPRKILHTTSDHYASVGAANLKRHPHLEQETHRHAQSIEVNVEQLSFG